MFKHSCTTQQQHIHSFQRVSYDIISYEKKIRVLFISKDRDTLLGSEIMFVSVCLCVCVCAMRIVSVRSFKGASEPQFKANLHNVLNYVTPHTI